ncbi:Cytidine and deoxycytidylate deaminase zinc-binding region [Nocardia amikacinitolerans]|uniref:Cytidine and deoxycytidylate deaminase zinc-binding region n=1 Tax=Nocardia amikacinitolerans TaxID=756689 RepID=A0A285L8T3_9NOCA|nr:nucleoside deaminase [Nocardia amikacinitolerans]MCP2297906.1 Cytidine and deoxycytidylate deaminase zinc-binding region [Nocardia amikacinitolerans]SNY80006.1 Cytidine and deoxycytidylate deaminase zinc-binding region [Nocardia amikacinitolerans]
MVDDADMACLRRCVDLAREALDGGNAPFGSLLVSAGRVVAEARNEEGGGDPTRHPELELVHWAIANLTPAERAAATVYTSGEHCPMCSAAHAWAGLGRIVYASSAAQLTEWLAEMGVPPAPVRSLPINEVAPGVPTEGPAPQLAGAMRELHRLHRRPHG